MSRLMRQPIQPDRLCIVRERKDMRFIERQGQFDVERPFTWPDGSVSTKDQGVYAWKRDVATM